MKLNTWRIKVLMAERELSQASLAQKCGLHRQRISDILIRGRCNVATAGKLAKGLGVSVCEIVEED